jgi:hypothetical protein
MLSLNVELLAVIPMAMIGAFGSPFDAVAANRVDKHRRTTKGD